MVSERDVRLPTVQRNTLQDHAYRALQEAILDGRLTPGERLVEIDLSLSLGISRGPLREAMRQLESEGLIVRHSHQGTHVVRPTGRDILELYGVRAALEGFAATQGIETLRATGIPRLRDELPALARAGQERDWDRVAVLDTAWHKHIVEASRNQHLERVWRTANGPLRVLYAQLAARVYEPEQVLTRHLEVLEVLATGTPERIEAVLRAHYLDTARHFAHCVDDE